MKNLLGLEIAETKKEKTVAKKPNWNFINLLTEKDKRCYNEYKEEEVQFYITMMTKNLVNIYQILTVPPHSDQSQITGLKGYPLQLAQMNSILYTEKEIQKALTSLRNCAKLIIQGKLSADLGFKVFMANLITNNYR